MSAGPTSARYVDPATWTALGELAAELDAYIAWSLKIDGHCKSYEGAWDVHVPNYFDTLGEPVSDAWGLTLHCYLVGPGRHYTWTGYTLAEALDYARADVRAWIAEDDEYPGAAS